MSWYYHLVGVVRHAQIANQIEEFPEGQYLRKNLMDCLENMYGGLHFIILNGFVEANHIAFFAMNWNLQTAFLN